MVAAILFVEDNLASGPFPYGASMAYTPAVYAHVPSTGLTYKLQPDASNVRTLYSSENEFFSTSSGYVYIDDGGGSEGLIAVSANGPVTLDSDNQGEPFHVRTDTGRLFTSSSETVFTADTLSVVNYNTFSRGPVGGNALFITDGSNAPRILFDAASIRDVAEVGDSFFISTSRYDPFQPIGERLIYGNYLVDRSGNTTFLDSTGWPDNPAHIGHAFAIVDTFTFQGNMYVSGKYNTGSSTAASTYSAQDIYRIDGSNGQLIKTGLINPNSVVQNDDDAVIRTFSPSDSSPYFYFWKDAYGTTTQDLYRSDGTAEGTVLIGAYDVYPSSVAVIGNRMIFGGFGAQPIMSTDGTSAGTFEITGEGTPAGWVSTGFNDFITAGNNAFFATDSKIYITDGTQGGTRIVFQAPEHLQNGGLPGTVELLHAVDGKVYFWATYNDDVMDLWVMDSNGANAGIVTTIDDGSGQYNRYTLSGSLVDLPASLLNSSEILVDPVQGSPGPDTLSGSATADLLKGLAGDDLISGLAGNDRMEGGAGQDRLDGGSGEDTAIYSGDRSDYVVFIAANGDVIVLDSNAARDGQDTLLNTESLQFADQTLTTSQAVMPVPDADNSAYEVYRFFNTLTGTHFFTTSLAERNELISNNSNFSFEGNSFDSNATSDNGGAAVYRFFNTQTGVHFYTADAGEADNIRSNLPQFNDEGIVYYAHTSADAGGSALYRFYNTENGSHFFTPSEAERDTIIGTLSHFNYEGIAYYVDGA